MQTNETETERTRKVRRNELKVLSLWRRRGTMLRDSFVAEEVAPVVVDPLHDCVCVCD